MNYSTDNAPVSSAKRSFLLVRWLLVIVCSVMIIFSRDLFVDLTPAHLLILCFVASNLLMYLLPESAFKRSNFYPAIGIGDIFLITLALVISGQTAGDVYVMYFLMVIIAALSQELIHILVRAAVVIVFYGLVLWWATLDSGPESDIFLRLPFFFVVAVFYGYLVQLARSKRLQLGGALELSRTGGKQEELQTWLRELNEDITKLDSDSLLKKITERAREFFQADLCDLRVVENGVWYSRGIAGLAAGQAHRDSGVPRGRFKWILDHGKPLALADVTRGTRLPDNPPSGRGIRGYLGVPILSNGGNVIGAFRIMTYKPRTFTAEDIDLLQQLGNGAQIALRNAHLLQDLKLSNQELGRSAAEIQATNARLNRLLEQQSVLREFFVQLSVVDMAELLKKVTGQALRLLRVNQVRVLLLGEDGILRMVAADGERAEDYLAGSGESTQFRSTWAMENQTPLAIKDITQDPAFAGGRLLKELGVRGYLGLPLISRGQKSIGVLVAHTFKERVFTEEEIGLAEQFAAGAAIALENARLYERTKRQEEIQKLLKELSQDITSLDIDTLLQKLTDKVRDFMKADVADLRVIEGPDSRVVGLSGSDPSRLGAKGRGGGRHLWYVENRRPLIIPDISEDSPLAALVSETTRRMGVRGYLGAPLLSRSGDVVGVFRVLSVEPREFTREEAELLLQLANGAAVAIENANLFEEVKKKTEEIEEAYQTKSDFLNTMAHELRTHLNVIMGNTQLLHDGYYGEIDDRIRNGLKTTERNAQALLHLINEILDLARLEAKNVPLSIAPFPIDDMMEELEASFVSLSKEKGLELRVVLADGLPVLKTDRAKVKTILQNLLANAVKYTDRGVVELAARYQARESENSDCVTFSVSDTGIGMVKEDLESIFEPFRMVEGLDRAKYPGSGLGLSLVRRLAELLKGTVAVESESGQGSTFTVKLPIVHPDAN
ncbi:MAG: GAF domain-containing protein [Candidatus Binatia bacterium]